MVRTTASTQVILVICRDDQGILRMPRNWIPYELSRKSVGELSKVQPSENGFRHVGLGDRVASPPDLSSVSKSRISLGASPKPVVRRRRKPTLPHTRAQLIRR